MNVETVKNTDLHIPKNDSPGRSSGSDKPGRDASVFDVEIGGTPLRLRSSNDQRTVTELVEFVNRKFKEAMPFTRSGSPQNATILASLHMAEEFLAWKRKAQAELDELRRQTQSLLSELESTRVSPVVDGSRG